MNQGARIVIDARPWFGSIYGIRMAARSPWGEDTLGCLLRWSSMAEAPAGGHACPGKPR